MEGKKETKQSITGLRFASPSLPRQKFSLLGIVRGAAKRERDWGHLVLTDIRVNRCLPVMVLPPVCGEPGFSHEDYAKLTKWHAHRFMAMCMCIFHDHTLVKWVRATYVTEDELARPDFSLHLELLGPGQPPASVPRVFTATHHDVGPCLLARDITRIDSTRAQDPESPVAPVPKSVRGRVEGGRDARPDLGESEWQQDIS